MVNSKSLDDLLPSVKARILHFIAAAEFQLDADFPGETHRLMVLSTYRDEEAQQELYDQGRTLPGKIVTNAKPGESWHNHRCAADLGVKVNGQLSWDRKYYERMGEVAKWCGLTWGGDWNGDGLQQKADFDLDHFQWTNGLTLADLRAGKLIEDVA